MRKGKKTWSKEEGKDEKIFAQVMAENWAEDCGTATGLPEEKESCSGLFCVDTEIYRTKEGAEADGLRSSGAKSSLKDGGMDGEDYEELVNERIAKAVLSRPVLHMDYAEFDAWLKDGQRKYMAKRRRRGLRCCSIAICICLCIGAVAMIPPLVGESSAARDDDMTVVEEDGNIIIGGDGEAGVGASVAKYESLDEVNENDKEKMILFEIIPYGYNLELIEIKKTNGLNITTLNYKTNSERKMIIKEREYGNEEIKAIALTLNNYETWYKKNSIVVYRSQDTGSDVYFFTIENIIVNIKVSDEISEKEIEAMIDSLYRTKS